MDQENFNNTSSLQYATTDLSLYDIIKQLRKIKSYLLSQWKIIVLISILGSFLGIGYSYFKGTYYIANTTFVLEDDNSIGGSSQYSGVASLLGVSGGGPGSGIFQGDNIMQLYKSHNMIERALLSPIDSALSNKLLLDKYFEIIKLKKNNKILKVKFVKNLYSNRLQDSILNIVVSDINNKYLTVSRPDKKLSIIQVSVKSSDEQFSKMFCDQIVKTVNEFYIQTKTKKSLENLTVLQHQTDSVKSVLNGYMYHSVAVADATPNLNPSRQILRLPVQKSQLGVEANKILLNQLVQNLELAKINTRKDAPLIQVIDQPIMPLPVEKLGQVKAAIMGFIIVGFLTMMVLLLRKFIQKLII